MYFTDGGFFIGQWLAEMREVVGGKFAANLVIRRTATPRHANVG